MRLLTKGVKNNIFLSALSTSDAHLFLLHDLRTVTITINSSPWIVKLKERSRRPMKSISNPPMGGWKMLTVVTWCTGDPVSITKVTDHQSSSQWGILKNAMSLGWLEKNTAQIKAASLEHSCFWNSVLELRLERVPIRILKQIPKRTERAEASSQQADCPVYHDST